MKTITFFYWKNPSNSFLTWTINYCYSFKVQKKAVNELCQVCKTANLVGVFFEIIIFLHQFVYILYGLVLLKKKNLHLFPKRFTSKYNLRRTDKLVIPYHKTECVENQVYYRSINNVQSLDIINQQNNQTFYIVLEMNYIALRNVTQLTSVER